ncbi:hypothetical protein DB30_02097 [Enhygromyxa salina]|uniref:Uncharacterized protein n=1 Tax=Enhygromyxa salina TaxID=215803 RepID=A0A0C2CVY9_9BACT|nr:hypothetical protein [Enhygromyxa salina]KIG12042.1 hypothetical protein DB30_02097 [Enhygromyxa salina]
MEVHLPCPPLAEWLPVRLAGLKVAAWAPRKAPRRVRSTLLDWPTLADDDPDAPTPAQLDALLFGTWLERPNVPESCLAALRPGTLIIELAVPRRRIVRGLLGIDPRPLARAAASQARVLQWLARGYHQPEQWESVNPHGVIVTLARARHGG